MSKWVRIVAALVWVAQVSLLVVLRPAARGPERHREHRGPCPRFQTGVPDSCPLSEKEHRTYLPLSAKEHRTYLPLSRKGD